MIAELRKCCLHFGGACNRNWSAPFWGSFQPLFIGVEYDDISGKVASGWRYHRQISVALRFGIAIPNFADVGRDDNDAMIYRGCSSSCTAVIKISMVIRKMLQC